MSDERPTHLNKFSIIIFSMRERKQVFIERDPKTAERIKSQDTEETSRTDGEIKALLYGESLELSQFLFLENLFNLYQSLVYQCVTALCFSFQESSPGDNS